MIDEAWMVAAAVTPGMARGFVTARGDESVTVVIADGTDDIAPCDVLLSGAAPPVLAVGDEVLVWRGDRGQRGVVLGRVGVPRAVEPAVPEELVIEAGERLTLRCGDGSITLRADGKVLIKGRDLVSHAQRANRIKGGSVAIN
jgi:hypothetical protein